MKKRIGIPRGMLAHQYLPLWKEFFEQLDLQVVLSAHTTKDVVNAGVKAAVDEACLPVKVYYGHVLNLLGKVDYLFCPRLVSVEPKTYVCPKFLGLPDMIRNNVANLPIFIDTTVNLHGSVRQLWPAVYELGRHFTTSPVKIYRAFKHALKRQQAYELAMQQGLLPSEAMVSHGAIEQRPGKAIAVIGHSYNIYDDHISMNLIKKLRQIGYRVVTPEMVTSEVVEHYAGQLPKKLFWNMGKQLIGSAYYYMEQPEIVGMIHVAAFGCGPDSFTSEFIERRARREGKPYLNLTIDEHTGEAGVVTRIEAFVDMINWRENRGESNFSTHG